MTAKAFEIQVQDDHLARIAQARKPILALAELIWNAVDADATRIDVTLTNNDLDGLEAIEVTDNGHGIPYAQAEDLFSRLGGSWKQSRTHSNEENHILHGKEGRGRFSRNWRTCRSVQTHRTTRRPTESSRLWRRIVRRGLGS